MTWAGLRCSLYDLPDDAKEAAPAGTASKEVEKPGTVREPGVPYL